MTKMTVDRLVALGGKVWERGEMKRVYFNYEELARFYGLEYDGWKFTVDGEKVSNNSGRQFASDLRNGKFWYDLATGEFGSKDMNDKMTDKIVDRIMKAVEEFAAETENGETVETATEEVPVVNEVRTAVGPGIPAQAIRTNRRPGHCRRCRQLVPAGKGRLYYIDPDEAYEDSGWIVEHIDCK